MSLTLQSLRSMTLLQIVTLPEQELDSLYREAVQELNHASRCLKAPAQCPLSASFNPGCVRSFVRWSRNQLGGDV